MKYTKNRALCILSGGMDSTLSAYMAKNHCNEITTVHFNYGQKTQKKELEAFREISKELGAKTYEIDIDFFKTLGANALVDNNLKVPTDGLSSDVPITYVPFRNGIFLSIASAIAEKEKINLIYIGVVWEDSSGYPDCKESFIKSMQNSINLGTKDETNIQIVTPLIDMKKDDIVKQSIKLGVKLEKTWSCYQNEDEACGVCDSCRLRLKGFKKANIKDPIPYIKLGQL